MVSSAQKKFVQQLMGDEVKHIQNKEKEKKGKIINKRIIFIWHRNEYDYISTSFFPEKKIELIELVQRSGLNFD